MFNPMIPKPRPIGSDVINAVSQGSFNCSSQSSIPWQFVFSKDGSKGYILDANLKTAFQYTPAVKWDVDTLVYDSVSYNFSTQITSGSALSFRWSSNGKKAYVLANIINNIFEYNASTAWDLSTLTYSTFFNVSSENLTPRGLFFHPNGSKMWITGLNNITGGTNTAAVHSYILSTPGDVSTAVYDSTKLLNAQETNVTDVAWNSLGNRMYVTGATTNDAIYQYSTPVNSLTDRYNISSLTYDGLKTLSDTINTSIYLKPDNTRIYISGNGSDLIYQYFVPDL